MKVKVAIGACLVYGFTSFSCASKIQKQEQESTNGSSGQVSISPSSNAKEDKVTERLTISFYSVAYGIDYATKEAIDQFVTDFEQKNNIRIPVEKVNWGREGEIDYCYDLQNISENISTTFLTQVREITDKGKNIHIKENEPCRIPRQ